MEGRGRMKGELWRASEGQMQLQALKRKGGCLHLVLGGTGRRQDKQRR